ncbi:outer membrane protein assembly factor BamA [Palleronia sp. LCG004]|uniref:outer membrane protein assembly factor BamA n=1 Tax=Palleronia sp. LCG004 TaxID=3079304 RepID=UPI002942C534|nr:outer membrane protein assembly factor BamA [Palleronia sp. LCG004]WOI57016.1 outer membrane protein assembly factor BamA [Palleronia sp. LCG004]
MIVATGMDAGPATAQNFTFLNVAVEGNQRVEPASVLSYIDLPRGTPVSAGELNAAYQRLVNSGLFETVEIVPQGNTLVVRVQEWPTINRINIEGNARIDDASLSELVVSTPRRVYSPSQAEEDAAAIAAAYEQQGRLAASVTPRIIRRSQNRVDLVFEVAEGGVVEIERLSFVGNRAYSDGRLRRVLATKQAGLLRRFISRDSFAADRLELDRQLLTDFYASRGYVDFRILDVASELSRDRDAFFVTYNVQEGQSFDFGGVTASTSIEGLDAQDYLAVAQIRRGQTYTPQAIDNAIARMERLAIQRGLNFVRAVPQVTRNPRDLTLDVNFLLERGERIFVERIDIEGNATTLDRVIRREFNVVEGDPFNPREIRAAAERIRALGFFSDASVDARDGTGPGQVIIDVDVEEQPTGSLTLGGAYSTDSGIGVNLGYSERNFLGRGQTLSFGLSTASSSQSASLSFIEPYFLGRDLSLALSAFYETTDLSEADYNTRSVGFSPALAFPVSLNGRLQVRYRLAKETIFDVDEDSSPIIQADEGGEFSSSIGYTYTYDTRRTGLNPNAGILLRFGQDLAGLGGDADYLKTTASATAQTLVWNEEVTLRATLEGGSVNSLGDNDVRVIDRFFLNSRQMRGFEPLGLGPRDVNAPNEDALGGNLFAVARFEAEFPLGLPEEYGISGGVFFDAGSVWSLDNTDGFGGVEVDDSFNLRSSVGVSIFWTTPLGPLRFNFAKALVKEDYDRTQAFNVSVQTSF